MYDSSWFRTQLNILQEAVIDNKHGVGATPYNQDIDYFGLRVLMRPSVFLKLALPLAEEVSVEFMVNHLKSGGSIGAPFLQLRIPGNWEEKDEWDEDDNKVTIPGNYSEPAKVVGHEGRNRMTAIIKVYGDDPVEVHILPGSFYRARHMTPEFVDAINRQLIPEGKTTAIPGPFFTVS